jgi:hypothetical protein
MSTSNKGSAFIDEFREFITFLQSLWGILAGISVLFPLSNSLIEVIPLAQKLDTPTYEFINSNQVTAVTTLIALFVIIWTFGRRHEFKTQRKYHQIRSQALLSFGVGFLALILYYVLFYGIYGIFYEPFNITSGEPLRLLGDVSLMLFYSGFFVLITRAFILLGMIEFYR